MSGPPNSRRDILNRSVDRLTPPVTRNVVLLLLGAVCLLVAIVCWLLWCRYSDGAARLGAHFFP